MHGEEGIWGVCSAPCSPKEKETFHPQLEREQQTTPAGPSKHPTQRRTPPRPLAPASRSPPGPRRPRCSPPRPRSPPRPPPHPEGPPRHRCRGAGPSLRRAWGDRRLCRAPEVTGVLSPAGRRGKQRGRRYPRAGRRRPAWRAGEARRGRAARAADWAYLRGWRGRSARRRAAAAAGSERGSASSPLGAAPDGAPPPAPPGPAVSRQPRP